MRIRIRVGLITDLPSKRLWESVENQSLNNMGYTELAQVGVSSAFRPYSKQSTRLKPATHPLPPDIEYTELAQAGGELEAFHTTRV